MTLVVHDGFVLHVLGGKLGQHKQPFGIVKDWVELMLHSPAAMPELLKRGDQTHKCFEIRTYPWDPPLWEGKSFCLQKNDQEPPILRAVETVTVIGESNFEVGEFQMQHGKLDNITIAWGTGLVKGQEALLVASKDEKAEIKLSVAYGLARRTVMDGPLDRTDRT